MNMIDRQSEHRLPVMNGERKVVTVAFADIVQSSEFVAGHDPEDANDHLLPVLQAMIDAVHRFGGTVNQILGDGIMAVFGAPMAQEDHALRACLAAQVMQMMATHALRNSVCTALRNQSIRIGISSGDVVAQTLKGDFHTEYRIVGETVYRASRLENAATPGSIFVCRDTVRLSRGAVEAEPVGAVTLSTEARAIEAMRLKSVVTSHNLSDRTAETGAPALVGRQDELAALRKRLEETKTGTGASIVVTSDAGVGKSRIVRELVDDLSEREYRVVECELHPTGLARPSGTISRVLRGVLGLIADDREALEFRLDQIDLRDPMLRIALLEVLGHAVDDPGWAESSPSEKLRLTVDAAVSVIVDTAQDKPTVIVLEDIHWADTQTRAFAKGLSGCVANTAIMLLATSRIWTEPVWTAWDGVVERRLEPLDPELTQRLLDKMLGVRKELAHLKQRLVEMTQGVPFFIVECVRSLKETGALQGQFGSHRLMVPTTEIQIPATVHGLLAARIDTLPASDRYVLLCAAVVGQSFDVGLLQEITGRKSQDVLMQLNRLQAAGFVNRTRIVPNLEFSFQHALTHDVAYETLLKSLRRDLHGMLMTALERRRSDQMPGRVELLAHHAFCSQSWAKAVVYGRFAARAMLSASRNAEAATCLERAMDALTQLDDTRRNKERRIDLALDLFGAYLTSSNHDAADELLTSIEITAKEIDCALRLGRISSARTLYYWVTGKVSKAIATGKDALQRARQLGDPALKVLGGVRLGALYIDRGDFEAACTLLKSSINSIPREHYHKRYGLLPAASVTTLASLSRGLAELGHFGEALDYGDEAIQIADDIGHGFSQIYANLWVGNSLLKKGDFERSIPLLERSYEMCERTSADLLFPRSASSLGYAYARTGQTGAGLALLTDAVKHADRQAIMGNYSQQLAWLAEAELDAGEARVAADHATLALEAAVESGEKGLEAWSLWLLGEVHNHLSDQPEPLAERYFTKAWDMAKAHRMSPLVAHCHMGLARFYMHHAAPRKAKDQLDFAISTYRELDMGYWLKVAHTEALLIDDLHEQRVH
ncbi:MAG: adenylate/guanylate cyclase domain-containing protein [Pseudomonadota bacterium]